MNTISRTITGTLAIIIGTIIIISTFYSSFVFLAYGIPIFIAGFFILFNKKEDDIEKIKQR